MQARSSFIENIAALDANALNARRSELNEVFNSEVLTLARLVKGISENTPLHEISDELIQQFVIIGLLKEHIIRADVTGCVARLGEQSSHFITQVNGSEAEVILEEVAFQYFLDPNGQDTAVKKARKQVRKYHNQPASSSDEDEGFDVGNDAAENLLGQAKAQQSGKAATEDYAKSEKILKAIEDQQNFLNSLSEHDQTMLTVIVTRVMKPYSKLRSTANPIKQLRNFSQFLIFLMSDALMQLQLLLSANPQIKHDLSDNHRMYMLKIEAAVQNPDTSLPPAKPIVEAQSRESVEQFLGHLVSAKRSLRPKETAAFEDEDADVRSEGSLEEGVAHASRNDTVLLLPVLPQKLESKVYPMPVYLAKSLKSHLVDAIEEDAKSMGSVSDVTNVFSPGATSEKKVAMHEGAAALRISEPAPVTLQAAYQIKLEGQEKTLLTILTEKRGTGEASAFARTLAIAGINFLAENPASLMRRYIFLTQLGAVADFADLDNNEKIYQKHLVDTIAEMSFLRKSMLTIYLPTPSSSAITARMKELIAFAGQHQSVDILVRLLLVVCLDKLDPQAFTDLSYNIKNWIRPRYEKGWNQNDFIKAVAENITQKTAVKKHGIRAWEKALLEINSFQQGRYPEDTKSIFATHAGAPYTALEHQVKLDAVNIHLGACIDNYFKAPQVSEKNLSVIDLTLMNRREDREKEDLTNDLGADKGVHGTQLRLVTNLKSYWEVALTSSVNVGSITATTLALVNSGELAALAARREALVEAAKKTPSPELHANAWIMSLANRETRPYNIFDIIDVKFQDDFKKRVTYYRSIIKFAEVLVRHLASDQAQSKEVCNDLLPKVYVAARDCVEFLKGVLRAEKVRLLQTINKETSAVLYNYARQQSNTSFAEMSSQELMNQGVSEVTPLNDLEIRTQAFSDNIRNTCFPITGNDFTQPADNASATTDDVSGLVSVSVNLSIQKVRESIYGEAENIINPNLGPAFEDAFEKALTAGNDEFFVKALFTLEHHPIKPDTYLAELCKRIGKYYKGLDQGSKIAETWTELSSKFDGNATALEALFRHYVPVREKAAEILNVQAPAPWVPLEKAAIEKALKIATFGFSNETFASDKLIFARKMVFAFAELTKVEANEDIIAEQANAAHLIEAFIALEKASEIMSAEERLALSVLRRVVEKLQAAHARKYYDILYRRAERHATIHKFLEKIYSRSEPILSTEEVENDYHAAINIAMNVNNARENLESNVKTLVQNDNDELDALVKRITDICFDPQLRYYDNPKDVEVTKTNRQQYKITTQNDGRITLIQRCQTKIAALLKEGKLTAETLKAAMQELRKEALEGGLESTKETLQWAPHSMSPLEDRKFTFLQTDIFLNAFKNRIAGITRKMNEKSKAQKRESQRISSRLGNTNASELLSASTAANAQKSTVEITSEAVLAAGEWFDSLESPRVDSVEKVGNAPDALRRALDISVITQLDVDDFMVNYRRLGSLDQFELRVGFLRDERADLCHEHIRENVRTTTSFQTLGYLSLALSSTGYRTLKIVPSTQPISEGDFDSVTLFVKIADDAKTATVYWMNAEGKMTHTPLVVNELANGVELLIERLLRANRKQLMNADEDEAEVGDVAVVADSIPDLMKRLKKKQVLKLTDKDLIADVEGACNCTHHHPHDELVAFIQELRNAGAGYADHLESFVWSIGEMAVLPKDDQSEDDAPEDDAPEDDTPEDDTLLALLKDKHQYDWDTLIFLGCKRYATMSEVDRSKKGPRLLKALVKLAQPLKNILTDNQIEKIKHLKIAISALVIKHRRTLFSSSLQEMAKEVNKHIMDYLRGDPSVDKKTKEIYNFIGGKDSVARNTTLENIPESSTVDDIIILNTEGARLQYAAYLSITALEDKNKTKNSADVYYHIYTLAQAAQASLPEVPGINLALNEFESEDALDEDEVEGPTVSKKTNTNARNLLGKLHGELAEPVFAKWHREMIDVSKGLPSSLAALIRHQPHGDANWRRHEDGSHNIHARENHVNIESRPYYWYAAYDCHSVYDTRFAYEAHAVYELEKLYQMETFEDEVLETQYKQWDSNKTFRFLPQKNSRLEQQALAFMAAKYWYQDQYSSSTSAPFAEAIRSLAKTHQCKPEAFIQTILKKACDSLNLMLVPVGNQVAHEALYGLNTTQNQSLKLEMMRWIKSTPEIAKVYIVQTNTRGVASEEQADFVLQLPKGAALQSSSTQNRSSSESGTASMFNTPQHGVSHSALTPNSGTSESTHHSLTNEESTPRQALLFKAFNWKYEYINERIFSTSDVKARLKAFIAQINTHSLRQEYYAYIAGHESSEYVNCANFANLTSDDGLPHRFAHAYALRDLLLEECCENQTVLTNVLVYILKSFCAANEKFGWDAHIQESERKAFYICKIYYLIVQLYYVEKPFKTLEEASALAKKQQQRTQDEHNTVIAFHRKMTNTYNTAVPHVVKGLLTTFAQQLDVQVVPKIDEQYNQPQEETSTQHFGNNLTTFNSVINGRQRQEQLTPLTTRSLSNSHSSSDN